MNLRFAITDWFGFQVSLKIRRMYCADWFAVESLVKSSHVCNLSFLPPNPYLCRDYSGGATINKDESHSMGFSSLIPPSCLEHNVNSDN